MVPDQVVDTEAAAALSIDVSRNHGLAGWIIVRDQPQPGEFTARLATAMPTPYVLRAETLAALRAALPTGLTWSGRQPNDPPDLVEIWFVEPAPEAPSTHAAVRRRERA
ncbi:MAG: hypothetical protein ACJ8AI_27820 [Rhodopila sp.]